MSICILYWVSADCLLGLSDVNPLYVQRKGLEKYKHEEMGELVKYEVFREGDDSLTELVFYTNMTNISLLY